VVDKDRVFRGGVICPGLSTGLRALGERCAQLPQVHLGSPKKAIGTNTESCMLSGSVLGTAVLIDGMVQRIEEELGSPATLVVTGGLAKYVTPLCRHPLTYDPELLMKGLALLYQLNAPQEHGRSHGGGRHYGQQGRLRAKHPHPNRRTRREPEALVG
jgi:pantothenate kinase, type III